MNEIMQKLNESLNIIWEETDVLINEMANKGNVQFSNLIGALAIKFDWNEKDMRLNDPLVRHYIRANPAYLVTRGAKGGVMKAADKISKEAEKALREAVKAQIKADIEAKVALVSTPV